MNKVYLGDSRNMSQVVSSTADLIVFDPPLWNHVKYSGDGGQLGNLDNYAAYMADLEQVARECCRILKEGGVLTVAVPDVMIMQGARVQGTVAFHQDIHHMLEGLGLNLVSTVAVAIGDVKQREYIPTDENQAQARGDFRTSRLIVAQVFSKGQYASHLQSKVVLDYWNSSVRFGSESAVLGSRMLYRLITKALNWRWLWQLKKSLVGKRSAPARPTYPVRASSELFEWLIDGWTRGGDTIVDPFLGSGTTLRICQKLGRTCVGFEINRQSRDVILDTLRDPDNVEFIEVS